MTPLEVEVNKFYDGIAIGGKLMAKFPNFWRPEFDALTKSQPVTFFDLGCGDGRETGLYRELFGNLNGYFGLDLSAGMLKYVKSFAPEAKLIRARLGELPFANASLPVVWAAASYLHVDRDQITGALEELFRVLAVKGHGFISLKTNPKNQPDYNKDLTTYYELAEFGRLLKSAGFEVTCRISDPDRDPRGVTWLGFFFTKLE